MPARKKVEQKASDSASKASPAGSKNRDRRKQFGPAFADYQLQVNGQPLSP